MRKIYLPILAFFMIFQGCIMVHSSVNLKKQKKNTINELPSALENIPTILDKELDIESLRGIPTTENSTFFISMVNYHDNTYVEMRLKEFIKSPKSLDDNIQVDSGFVWLSVSSKNLLKSQVTEFDIVLNLNDFNLKYLKSNKKNSFEVIFSIDTLGNDEKRVNSFKKKVFFENYQAFEIEKDVVHLYTGTLKDLEGGFSKFLIVNDLTDPEIPDELLIYASTEMSNIHQRDECEKRVAKYCKNKDKDVKYVGGVVPFTADPFDSFKIWIKQQWRGSLILYECTGECKD